MPTVPRYTGGAERTALQTPRRSNNAPSSAFGVQQPNILEGAAQNLTQMVEVHKQKADQVAVLDAENGLAALESKILYDAKDGVLNRRGTAAFDAPERATEEWQAGVSELEAKLSNTRQRQAFANAKAQREVSLHTAVQQHVSSQLREHDTEVTQSFLTNERQAALVNYQDEKRVALGVSRMQATIRDFAARNGMSDEKRDEMLLDASSKTYAGAIDRMLTNDQDIKASAYYKQVKEYISGDDQAKVEKGLEEGSLRGQSQRSADAIMQKHGKDMDAALGQARQIKDPKVRDAVEQRINQRFEQQRAIEREKQEDLYLKATNILDAQPTARARDVVPPGMWANLTLPMRNALENRDQNVQNNDQKWLTFLELPPQKVANLTKPQFESEYWAHFDKEHRTRAEALWNANKDAIANKDAQPNLKLANTINFKDRLSNTMGKSNIIPPDKSISQLDKNEARTYAAFEQEAAKLVEQFELTQLGGKREATGEEMQQIIDNLVMKKVFMKPVFGGLFGEGPQRPAFGLTADQQGKAYVPLANIPTTEQQALRNIMKSRGVTISNDKMQRLFAASLIGNRTLFESILGEK